MDPKLLTEALDALIAGDDAKCGEILKQLVATAAGAQMGGGEPDADDAGAMKAPDPEQAAAMAASVKLKTITGKASIGEMVTEVERLSTVVADFKAREAKLAADRAALEASERDGLVAALVVARKVDPALAWEDPLLATDQSKRKPAEMFASMPIASLRDRVAKLGVKPGAAPPARGTKPPVPTTGDNPHGLTDRELAKCKDAKVDPADYARKKREMAKNTVRNTKAPTEAQGA